jgi:hypothetical protein
MRTLLRAILHAAIGGAAVGLATIPTGVPITTRNVILPALASALTSVFSLFTRNGTPDGRRY